MIRLRMSLPHFDSLLRVSRFYEHKNQENHEGWKFVRREAEDLALTTNANQAEYLSSCRRLMSVLNWLGHVSTHLWNSLRCCIDSGNSQCRQFQETR